MDIQKIHKYKSAFDAIAKEIKDDEGNAIEVWYARELQQVLGYARWENFVVAVGRAVEACKTMGINVDDHFREVTKMVQLGSGSERGVQDFMLTRYACYLIAQNGDPKKEEIAFAQSYFAVQTRKAELIEERLNEMDSHILYKYLDAEGGLKMLENGTLKFTNAIKFNDPFDCHPSLIDYSNIPNKIKGNKAGELLVKMYAGTPKRIIDGTWICSLTKRNDNLLMWSYYCNHKGICVGLNMHKVKMSLSKYEGIPIGCPEIEVQYKNIIEKPDYFRNMGKQDFLHYQIGTKATAWGHEEEVRLYTRGDRLMNLLNYNMEPYYLKIDGECFETLYLGVRIGDNDKNEIVNAARKLNSTILIYQMVTDSVAFKLNTEAI